MRASLARGERMCWMAESWTKSRKNNPPSTARLAISRVATRRAYGSLFMSASGTSGCAASTNARHRRGTLLPQHAASRLAWQVSLTMGRLKPRGEEPVAGLGPGQRQPDTPPIAGGDVEPTSVRAKHTLDPEPHRTAGRQ